MSLAKIPVRRISEVDITAWKNIRNTVKKIEIKIKPIWI